MSPGRDKVRLELVISHELDDWLGELAKAAGHGHKRRSARDLLEQLMVDDRAAHAETERGEAAE